MSWYLKKMETFLEKVDGTVSTLTKKPDETTDDDADGDADDSNEEDYDEAEDAELEDDAEYDEEVDDPDVSPEEANSAKSGPAPTPKKPNEQQPLESTPTKPQATREVSTEALQDKSPSSSVVGAVANSAVPLPTGTTTLLPATPDKPSQATTEGKALGDATVPLSLTPGSSASQETTQPSVTAQIGATPLPPSSSTRNVTSNPMQQLETQNKRLKAQGRRLVRDIVTLQSRVETLGAQIVNQEQQLAAANSSVSSLNSVVQELGQRKAELEKLLSEEQEAHTTTRRQANERIANLESGITEYSSALSAVNKECEDKAKEVETRTAETKDLRKLLNEAEMKFLQHSEQCAADSEAQQQSVRALQKKLMELDADLATQKEELLRTNALNVSLKANLEAKSNTKCSEQPREITSDTKENEKLVALKYEAQIATLENDLCAMRSNSNIELEKTKRELELCRSQLAESQSKVTSLKRQITAKTLASQHTHSTSDVVALENKVRSLTEQLRALQATPSDGDSVSITIDPYGGRLKPHSPSSSWALSELVVSSKLPTWMRPVCGLLVCPAQAFDNVCSIAARLLRNPLFRLFVVIYVIFLHCWLFLFFANWGPAVTPDGAVQQEGAVN
ncbi:hypothetical protein Pelo_9811 [Pelomyxa schiedti]|nr:hypothetical protein Pelo_9811 [Pelomyxa schiedti]